TLTCKIINYKLEKWSWNLIEIKINIKSFPIGMTHVSAKNGVCRGDYLYNARCISGQCILDKGQWKHFMKQE
ncbi:MAG: hypothetical protein K2N90_00915, partial [Lachnospiraceae bacterium]|nr:hypothetical protein [Lachnospiraceae bacterium]